MRIVSLNAGTKLGPYEILALLGAGGMGEIYRARDTRLDRTVAIKILPQHLSSSTLRERCEREGRAVASLNHPHICTLHNIGQQDGIDYVVMECLEGETLAERQKKGPLPLDQALRGGIQIADALDRAHCQGVVHRDLKPANIMPTKDGAKVLDFGLAKIGGKAGSSAGCDSVDDPDRRRNDRRNAPVHGAGATRGQGGGRRFGHLCLRGGAV